MATLVKIKGLRRARAVGDVQGVMSGRGMRVRSALGDAYPAGVKATRTPTANTQLYTAKQGGTYANAILITTVVGTLGVAVTYAASTGVPTITITAPATATLAANQAVVAAVNADPTAGQLVTASIAGTGAAAHAANGPTAMSGGTNVGTGQALYLRINGGALAIVDVDDPRVASALRRANPTDWISLGLA